MNNLFAKALTSFTIIAFSLLFLGLKNIGKSEITPASQQLNQEPDSSSKLTQQELNQESVMAINWFQQSGEYIALAHQAFNMSKLIFDQALTQRIKNPAVIVDIDETVLNNSAYQASLVNTNNSFPTNWDEWIKSKKATAIPGAVEFVNYVNSNGGKVFFISDRSQSSSNNYKNNDLELATVANLKGVGFSGTNHTTVLLKEEFNKLINGRENSSKQWRHEAVEKGLVDGTAHQIVVLVGDNLNDFDENAGTLNNERRSYVESVKNSYGMANFKPSPKSLKPAYIMLPNPMYGAWETGLYNPSAFGKEKWSQLSPSEKSRQRNNNLIKWANN